MRQTLSVSERRVCRTLGQHRSTQRKVPCGLPDEARLTEDIIALSEEFGRYGYRMITGMLNNSGWHVNHKRVERIWRREGLKVPQKPPNIIDEFTKEALVIRVKRRLNSTDVVDALTDLFILRGPPAFIRSDNGAEFIAKKVRAWIGAVGAKTAFIAPGSPWENGYCESFNARFRDELLNGEVFTTLREAQILIERWRRHYNTVRPHSALGYRPPAPKSIVPIDQRPTMH